MAASTTATYASTLGAKVRPLLDLNDRLRSLLREEDGIRVPSIAIIGNQSSGKSSVVERLAQVDLPRGAGMVTRAALVMALKRLPAGEEPYAVISGGAVTAKRIALSEINAHIVSITDEIAPGNEISDKAISLKVASPHVPDLTVVDLPGLVYYDEKTQSKDIYDRIKALYLRYIRDDNCVILVALPADLDAGTQEAFAIAKQADPHQERTIGIITKVDRVGLEGDADALRALPDRLRGVGRNAWAFKLGAVAVRNRNPDELASGASYEQVQATERAYFADHPTLAAMRGDERSRLLGFSALVAKLVELQYERIRLGLPSIAAKVAAAADACREQLAALPPASATDVECRSIFTRLMLGTHETLRRLWACDDDAVSEFAAVREEDQRREEAAAAATGDAAAMEATVPSIRAQLRLSPRLQDFAEAFDTAVRRGAPNVFTQAYRGFIAAALRESRGRGLPDEYGVSVTDKLVQREVARLRGPALAYLGDVELYMRDLMHALVDEHFRGYPALAGAVADRVQALLGAAGCACRARLDESLDMESDPVTLNHYYADTLAKVREWLARARADGRVGRAARPAVVDKNGGVIHTAETPVSPEEMDQFLERVASSRGDDARLDTYVVPSFAASPKGGASNFEQCVDDVAVRLHCYRKVVHKRFIDAVVQYARLAFPRKLVRALVPELQAHFLDEGARAAEGGGAGMSGDYDDDSGGGSDVLGAAGAGDGGGGGVRMLRLEALMEEPQAQRVERGRLTEQAARFAKALRLLQREGYGGRGGGSSSYRAIGSGAVVAMSRSPPQLLALTAQ